MRESAETQRGSSLLLFRLLMLKNSVPPTKRYYLRDIKGRRRYPPLCVSALSCIFSALKKYFSYFRNRFLPLNKIHVISRLRVRADCFVFLYINNQILLSNFFIKLSHLHIFVTFSR